MRRLQDFRSRNFPGLHAFLTLPKKKRGKRDSTKETQEPRVSSSWSRRPAED